MSQHDTSVGEQAPSNRLDSMMHSLSLKTDGFTPCHRLMYKCRGEQDQQWISFTAGKIDSSYSPNRTLHSVRSDARNNDTVFLTALKRVHRIYFRGPIHKRETFAAETHTLNTHVPAAVFRKVFMVCVV